MHSRKEDKRMLKDFNTIVLGKLRANRHKEHWSTLSVTQLIEYLKKEVEELEQAYGEGKPSRIALEAADVAAFAAMIADNITQK
jgi:NTP pyrophosphatase (non-canonical NTP hydrolase)